MNSTLKKWLLRIVIAGLTLGLIGWLTADFWKRQMQIYVLGYAEVRAMETGIFLPAADEVEVIALAYDSSKAKPEDERALGHAIHARATLRDKDAHRICAVWQFLRRGRDFSAMCHSPAYVLRFRKDGKMLLETSVCWGCGNYTLSMGVFGRTYYGFDAEGQSGQALLEALKSYVPLATNPDA